MNSEREVDAEEIFEMAAEAERDVHFGNYADDIWSDRNELEAEAFFAEYDNDPNVYDGTYSEE